jgi:hypothetical protein
MMFNFLRLAKVFLLKRNLTPDLFEQYALKNSKVLFKLAHSIRVKDKSTPLGHLAAEKHVGCFIPSVSNVTDWLLGTRNKIHKTAFCQHDLFP